MTVGLKGLNEFKHVIVVFYMHQAEFTPEHDLVRRPRGRSDMPEIGVFASRTKQRPNPLGISTAKLIKVEGSTLTVSNYYLKIGKAACPKAFRREKCSGYESEKCRMNVRSRICQVIVRVMKPNVSVVK